MSPCQPCTMDYSKGDGTGVHEAIGNWGFSNEVASPGHELTRLQCLLERMEALKSMPKCDTSPKKQCCRPRLCMDMPSRPRCNPIPNPNLLKPLITYNSVDEYLFTNDKKIVRADTIFPLYGRSYVHQGSSKWYKLGPLCCPQPSCPAPSCPKVQQIYCCQSHCL